MVCLVSLFRKIPAVFSDYNHRDIRNSSLTTGTTPEVMGCAFTKKLLFCKARGSLGTSITVVGTSGQHHTHTPIWLGD